MEKKDKDLVVALSETVISIGEVLLEVDRKITNIYELIHALLVEANNVEEKRD